VEEKGRWSSIIQSTLGIIKTKAALVYLLLAITLREAYLIVTQITGIAIFEQEYAGLNSGLCSCCLPFYASCFPSW
jgi:hypothetical protein